jgi:uncharacterized protein (DUF305 family)
MNTSMVQKNSPMYKQYIVLKGDDYDKAYLAGMSVHHQGAIDMAKLAITQASHPEIVTLAKNIVTSQAGEISQMESWQKKWDYPASTSSAGHDMNAMDMSMSMEGDMITLQSKTGDAFDKTFLEQMIAHHQSAIDMSGSAASNAKHQEVKDLAKNVITAQTAEIASMKQWQKDWNL